jgi:hypothetical protein
LTTLRVLAGSVALTSVLALTRVPGWPAPPFLAAPAFRVPAVLAVLA